MIPDYNNMERGLTAVPDNAIFNIQADSVTMRTYSEKKDFGGKFVYIVNL